MIADLRLCFPPLILANTITSDIEGLKAGGLILLVSIRDLRRPSGVMELGLTTARLLGYRVMD